ncbi:MAG: hypothetical protein OXD33_06625 [Rhodobacteraceae bacterium]|nr:hypothetical protein [Paracoccaceae bacterium]
MSRGPGEPDATGNDLLVIAALFGIGFGIWYLGQEELMAMAAIASATVSLPACLLSELLWRGGWQIPLISDWWLNPSRAAVHTFLATELASLHRVAPEINKSGGRNAALLVALYALRAARAARRWRPDHVCRKRHNLNSMIAEQARVWANADRAILVDPSDSETPETGEIAAAANVSLHPLGDDIKANLESVEKDVHACRGTNETIEDAQIPATGSFLLTPQQLQYRPPPLGRAARPEEWLSYCGINLDLVRRRDGRTVPSPNSQGAIDIAFAGQLTRRWRGACNLTRAHEQVFAACLGSFANAAREGQSEHEAEILIDSASRLFAACREPGDVAETLRNNPKWNERIVGTLNVNTPLLDSLATGFWWVETALLQIWLAGRIGGGVLAPARFLWMKPEDRGLWYAINCAGGNPVAEGSGIYAHHLSEKQHGMALPAPRVARAREALLDIYFDLKDRQRSTRTTQQPTVLEMPEPVSAEAV